MRKKIILLALATILLLASCGTSSNSKGGNRIEEDLTSLNIIEDNYRNYYEIFVRSFYDSDGDGIGDIKGVTKKLDYISDLGFNGIWLMPINESPSYHKYDVKDYYKIDPTYGSMEDLEELISECHKRKIKLILDMVVNHSSKQHPYFTKACNAYAKKKLGFNLTEEDEEWASFYTFYDTKAQAPGNVTTYRAPDFDFYYEANFSSDMPEFNCDNKTFRNEFKKIMEFYLDKGVDGFRFDAVLYFYYGNTAKNVAFLKEINKWVKDKNPNAYLVGECWAGNNEITQYYDSGVDSFFNFSASTSNPNGFILNSINLDGKSLDTYYQGMLNNLTMAKTGIPAPFIDNHDMPRFTSATAINKAKFQYGLLSMLNGSTFTYYGDEVGMYGSNAGTNPDQNVRIPILWGEDGKVGNCSLISGTNATRYPYPTVKEQMTDKYSILNFYKKCLLLRNQNPEIARGTITLIEEDTEESAKLFIKKTYNNQSIGIIFNFSSEEELKIDYKKYDFEKVVGQLVASTDDQYVKELKDGKIVLPPYSIVIVK